MKDQLETAEFASLCRGVSRFQMVAIKDFIRAHFTAKTVEDQPQIVVDTTDIGYMLIRNQVHGLLVSVSRGTNVLEKIIFEGTREECLAEKARLESIAKGGQEKGGFRCYNGDQIGCRCESQCVDCAFCYDDTNERPTPNSGNYRSELLTVATAAMNGMLANSIDKDQGVEPWWYMHPDRVAKYALEYGKSLITAIDKEVQSNK